MTEQIRVLKKCPELVEDFIERVVVLLVERSHGVVLCGVQVQGGGGAQRWCDSWGGSKGYSIEYRTMEHVFLFYRDRGGTRGFALVS